MARNCIFLIFGITGDLSKQRLIPAISNLIASRAVDNFKIIGLGRRQISKDDLIKSFHEVAAFEKVSEKVKDFDSHFEYVSFDFEKLDAYIALKSKISALEATTKWDKLVYLSTPPSLFESITKLLGESGLNKQSEHNWTRIVYEKPFGTSFENAVKLNKEVLSSFSENQVYRIDHYLGKELIGNISFLRFTNQVLEPLWNKNYIESVQIYLNENGTVNTRGEYYDATGAVRDMVQNHALQILSLIAMEEPHKLSAQHIREEKAQVLKKVRFTDALYGQYKGYRSEAGVSDGSTTETFAVLKADVENSRWRGVPFFIKTGKALAKKEAGVYIKFKPTSSILKDGELNPSNFLEIRIHPDEGFALELNAKTPGTSTDITTAKMDFCHSCLYAMHTPESYEKLLGDVLKGDQSVFVRTDEIEYSWKAVDDLLSKKNYIHTYEKGSSGPLEIKMFESKYNVRFKN